MRYLLILVSMLLLCGQVQARKVASLMRVTSGCQTYSDNGFSIPSGRLYQGDKVLLVSKSSSTARLIGTDGLECFVPLANLSFIETISDSGVKRRIVMFVKQLRERPYDTAYIDAQAAPWVALMARVLGNSKTAALPDLSTFGQTSDATASLEVANETQYTLRMVLSGPKSIVREIRPGGTWTEVVPDGSYDAFVETTSGKVTPLHSTWTAQLGYRQGVRLFIQTRYSRY